MSASRAAVAATLACALAGCSGASRPAPAADATGELRQFRSDLARRGVQVTVNARVPLDVTAVRVVADGFGPGPVSPVDVSLPAGSRVDLPAGYGPADCTARPGAARAVLALAAPGDRTDGTRELEVPLDDRGLLARLHAGECAERALAEQVAVTATAAPAAPGARSLRVLLRLQRIADGRPVVVHEMGAHIVFTVRPQVAASPLLVLEPQAPSAELALELTPTRCDGHALAENKRMGLLGVYVGLGADEPRLVTVTPDEATREALADVAVEGCRSR